MKKTFLLLVALALVLNTTAQVIAEAQARQIAQRFATSSTSSGQRRFPTAASKSITLAWQSVINNAAPELYVYNVPSGGFIIVSGDEGTEHEVLGWSDSGNFDADQLPDNLQYLVEGYAKGIAAYRKEAPSLQGTAASRPRRAPVSGYGTVEPLLKTTWGQTIDLYGYRYAGCVATAVAGILNYHRWPKQGYGSHTNFWDASQSIDFTQSSYAWGNIDNDDYNKRAAARQKVLNDVGCAVNMHYDQPNGSEAYTFNAFKALVTNFGYDESRIVQGYAPDATLRDELRAGRPVFYAGNDTVWEDIWVYDRYMRLPQNTVTVTAGPYYKVNFLFGTEDIGKLELRIDAGLKTSLEAEIKTEALEAPVDSINTFAYDILNRDNTVKTGLFAKVGWSAKFYKWEDDDTFWEKDRAWDFQGALVPKFQEPTGYYDSSSQRLTVNCDVDRNVLLFTTGTLGFALFDDNNKQVGDRIWDTRDYLGPTQWKRYSLSFNNVEPDKWYTVHPLCHLMGFELIGSPGKRIYSGVQDLIVNPLELQFDHQGGSGTINVKNTLTKETEVNVNYSNWQDTDWLSYEKANDGYSITVKPNTGYKRRLAQIEFVARDPNDTFGFSSRRQTVYVREDVDPAYLGLLFHQIDENSLAQTDYEGESIWVHGAPNPEEEDWTSLFGRALMPGSEDIDSTFNCNPVIQKNDDGTFTLEGKGLTITGTFDPVEPGQRYLSGSGTFKLNTDMDHHRKSAADVETVYRYNGVPRSAFGRTGAGDILDELANVALDEHFKRDIEGTVTVAWNETNQQYAFTFIGTGTLTYSANCYTRLSGITAGNGFDWYKPYPNATIIETQDYSITCNTNMGYKVFYELNE
ncbi:MAG: C10 family peptidase [Bacteroidaceae bacterium]|nr:C10 family peptidase [Bacteroidaceae bacterium]